MKAKLIEQGSSWVFKVTAKPTYADIEGQLYVYDNRHSIRVRKNDRFVYLAKLKRQRLEFTGAGEIERVEERPASEAEQCRGKNLHTIYTAHLTKVNMFEKPIVVSPTKEGQTKRGLIGLSRNLNEEGLSRSICRMDDLRFERILALGASK